MTRIPRQYTSMASTTLLTLLLAINSCRLVVDASQRSIHLNPDGRYSGIVVGFSGDFVAPANQNDMISRLMANLQNTSNILNELIGYQFGEVTIVLRDGWSVDMARLPANVSEAASFLTAAESDVIFTDDESEQILTMQWGECGEPGAPVNFPKTFMSDQIIMPRLLAHQWLLYRYGVFNEFGYVSDDSYPVYFAPASGSALNGSATGGSTASITSCSNRPEFNYTSQCGSQTVDPLTGLPNDRSCDVVPIEGSIASSYLYAPLVVSEYRLCDQKTHDFVSPNRQNALCDYQSAEAVISKHADFDLFKHQLSAKKPAAAPQPIHFRIWQQKSSSNPLASNKANLFYAFPAGYAYYKHLLSGDRDISSYLPRSAHFAKACFFTETELKFNDANDWKPSTQLVYPTEVQKPISGKIQLNTVLRKIVEQFSLKSVKMSGTVFFVFSGKHDVESKDVEQEVEQLADLFNAAGVGLRVVIVERMPSQAVLRFFDRLNSRLTASQASSVHYALSEKELTAANPIASQVYSTVSSLLWDTVQEMTENAHISLKRQTFNLPSTLNFTIDQSFKGLSSSSYSLLVEAFTSGASPLVVFTLSDQEGKTLLPSYSETTNEHLKTTLWSGSSVSLKPGFYRLEVKSSESGASASNSLVTVSIRILAETNPYRSQAKEAPILGRCWLRHDSVDGRYPARGYAQLSKGLNGPVYEADVSLIVRRFDVASATQEFHLPLLDNGRASPDITARDGIYSAYLDSVLGGGSSGPAAYSVMARVYSDRAVLKPANFGNTVMFKNRPRCCGSDLGLKSDDQEVTGGALERLINCGSFYSSGSGTGGAQAAPFAIRDLRLVSIDADNRTVTLQWSSPFVLSSPSSSSLSSKFPPEVKAFHSYTQHTQLPADIKEHWTTLPAAESEIVSQPAAMTHYSTSLSSNSILSSDTHYNDGHNGGSGNSPLGGGPISPGGNPYDQSEHLNSIFEMAPYEQTISMMSGGGSGATGGSSHPTVMSNSLRTVTLRILSAEEGFYFVAVAEHADDGRKTRPSNVLPVYMKKGTRRDLLKGAFLEWYYYLIIGICALLLLFILVALFFAINIRRSRHKKNQSAAASSSPSSHIDYEVSKKSSLEQHGDSTSVKQLENGSGGGGSSSVKSTYGGYNSHHSQDASSLLSSCLHTPADRHHPPPSNSGASNHTSCSSVNTVDQTVGIPPAADYLTSHHLDHPHHHHQQQQQQQQPHSRPQPPLPERAAGGSQSMLRELNLAQLLPNSYDSNYLLDQYNRVMDAKQRRNDGSQYGHPQPTHQQHQQQQRSQDADSPSIPSFGSSLENYNSANGQQQQQPQQPQYQPYHQQYSQSHHPSHAYGLEGSADHQVMVDSVDHHHQTQQPHLYAPYSNVNSIFSSPQQQQYQRSFSQHQQSGPSSLHHVTPAFTGYDDNGLPEYSVVRKSGLHHPNISQV